jgi:hypothetical protein
MLILVVMGLTSLLSGLFYYCQAFKYGLGVKRWLLAGLCFGPVVWPMFCMTRRMHIYRRFGMNNLLWRA